MLRSRPTTARRPSGSGVRGLPAGSGAVRGALGGRGVLSPHGPAAAGERRTVPGHSSAMTRIKPCGWAPSARCPVWPGGKCGEGRSARLGVRVCLSENGPVGPSAELS